MFQLEFGNMELQTDDISISPQSSTLQREDVASVLKVLWEEHCVECAVPECYSSCLLYEKRKDGNCVRFSYGIIANKKFKGHYSFGADLRFRKWSKLEANLQFAATGPLLPHWITNLITKLPLRFQVQVIDAIQKRQIYQPIVFDEFVLECYSDEKEPFNLILEYFTESNAFRTVKFRYAFRVTKGHNNFAIPFEQFCITGYEGYVSLFPESWDGEKRIIFTWLDFVKYQKRSKKINASDSRNLKKIKCVAWDLDNTLWDGTLVESTEILVKEDAKLLIEELDRRGIIQTIVSKNSFDDAWKVIQKNNLQDYFLYPAINWGQKSESLKSISTKLNIDLDTFAVLDDSAFERSEIQNFLPQVRTYTEEEIGLVLGLPEFDVPITAATKIRRSSYMAQIQRESIKENFLGSYDDFLISCEMSLQIQRPAGNDDVLRVWELIQRSNQLNLSSNRYSLEELHAKLNDPTILSVALSCKDRFGNYGIVGFATVEFSSFIPLLRDFVLSCRVAQKKVEHSFVLELASMLRQNGYDRLQANLIKTNKNLPLRRVFVDLPFESITGSDDTELLQIDLTRNLPSINVMSVYLEDRQLVEDFIVRNK